MKLLPIIMGLFLSFNVNADSIGQAVNVCKKLIFEAPRNECINKVKEAKFLSIKAMYACINFPSIGGITKCIDTIKDREYSDEEVQKCKDTNYQSYYAGVLMCLNISGKPYVDNSEACYDNMDLYAQINLSIDSVYAGDSYIALKTLNIIKEKLKKCIEKE